MAIHCLQPDRVFRCNSSGKLLGQTWCDSPHRNEMNPSLVHKQLIRGALSHFCRDLTPGLWSRDRGTEGLLAQVAQGGSVTALL